MGEPGSVPDPGAASGLRPVRPPRLGLDELLRVVPGLRPATGDPATVAVTGVAQDSRGVQPGDLYLARGGNHGHGIDHLAEAVHRGAVAVLTDPPAAGRAAGAGVPVLVAPDPRRVAGEVAAAIYGYPSQALLTIGITGTNGKTTTAWLVDAGLRAAGRRTGLVGTVATVVAGRPLPSARTTPEATDLQALLAAMRELGVEAVSLEVSSHALALDRIRGIRFDAVGFTNLSQDHLDFHGDMERYFAAKASLFTAAYAETAVIAIDDVWGARLAREAGIPRQTLAVEGHPDAVAADWVWHAAGRGLVLDGPHGRIEVPVALPGRFNLANAALAAALLLTVGVPAAAVRAGIGGLSAVPGRMQPIQAGQDFTVLVDYAHTPDALARVLDEARRIATPDRRVIVVFGCGGERDHAKRPLMGQVAAAGADLVIVTDDNPRSEDPAEIRAAVLAGTSGGPARVREVAGRREAIAAALAAAAAGDVVVIAGKGHERGQELADRVLPFDDAAVAEELLRVASPA